jgi:uncharacterized membrane protein YphA (DoxX/SURF4 family)
MKVGFLALFIKPKSIIMKRLSKLMQRGSKQNRDWFVVLRVVLGVLLLIKGIDFISNVVQLQEFLSVQKNLELEISWLPLVIAWAHIFGGLFIAVGLFTRFFCLVQLPIVTAALIMTISYNILSVTELFEVITAFVLLILFLLEGGGTVSLDRYYYYKKYNDLQLGS